MEEHETYLEILVTKVKEDFQHSGNSQNLEALHMKFEAHFMSVKKDF